MSLPSLKLFHDHFDDCYTKGLLPAVSRNLSDVRTSLSCSLTGRWLADAPELGQKPKARYTRATKCILGGQKFQVFIARTVVISTERHPECIQIWSSKIDESKYDEYQSVHSEVLAHGPENFIDDSSVSVIIHELDLLDPFPHDAMPLGHRDKSSFVAMILGRSASSARPGMEHEGVILTRYKHGLGVNTLPKHKKADKPNSHLRSAGSLSQGRRQSRAFLGDEGVPGADILHEILCSSIGWLLSG